MLQLLINLLTPIFEGMGVAPTDVVSYVNMLSGYIYAIFGTLRVHIQTLRRKLATAGKGFIQNTWGVGYKFVPPGQ